MDSDADGRRGLWRSRWAAIGAAVAVALGGGGIVAVNAASSAPSSVVTIDPVRILDTRTDVGLPGPFVSAVSQKLQVAGAAVPAGATGVMLNVTVVGPTAAGFLSVRPGDAIGVPSTSSLNFGAGDIVPNAVQVGLPTAGANAGQIDITYDAFGQAGPTTEVLIDVVGYMVAGGSASGPTGARGLSAWDVIPSGVTVTGIVGWDGHGSLNTEADFIYVDLPGIAPAGLTFASVNFAPNADATDDDPTCTGTFANPTAPAGKVCLYLVSSLRLSNFVGGTAALNTRAFSVSWTPDSGSDNLNQFFTATWAYHAP